MTDHQITPRRATLAAILSLVLVLVAPLGVQAECAWVLWGKVAGDAVMSPKEWFIRASFERREECARAYGVYVKDSRQRGWNVVGDQDTATGQGAVILSPVNPQYKENVVCRPDSIPPTQGGVLGS